MHDANAWLMKYLIDASHSKLFFVLIIIGINLNIFSSILIHKQIQFVDVNTINVLNTMTIEDIIITGLIYIKRW